MNSFIKPARKRSFINAGSGVALFFYTQLNSWIHLAAGFLAVAAGFYFNISYNEWLALSISIASVFIAEMLNTAVEFLGDAVCKSYNEHIRKAKDIGAGAVLMASVGAIITGCIIFLPKLF